jgi:hypothetical protein
LLSISDVPGLECLYTSFFPSFAAAPPVKAGEPVLSPSISGVSLYAFFFWLRRLRNIQMMIPRSARASGMPTAQPTIRPMLVPEPPFDEEPLLVLPPAAADGVVTTVWVIVTKPAEPDETTWTSEVMGVADD